MLFFWWNWKGNFYQGMNDQFQLVMLIRSEIYEFFTIKINLELVNRKRNVCSLQQYKNIYFFSYMSGIIKS